MISWLIARPWRTVVILLVIFGLAFLVRNVAPQDAQSTSTATTPNVSLTTPADFVGTKTVSLVGTVRALSEADIAAERPGRITAVNVTLGQTVPAGAVIATLENASEQAAVLQAEGAYDAAVAAAAQTELGVPEADTALIAAKEGAISSIRSAYTTTNGIILNDIDDFFSQPNSPLPGLRIGGKGNTGTLNNERVAYQELLPSWKQAVDSLTSDNDVLPAIDQAKVNVERTIAFVDIFLDIFDQTDDEKYATEEGSFLSLRNTLISLNNSLSTAEANIVRAEDARARALLAASGSGVSSADAQVKQALGSLRAAQAALAKTFLRTPVAGTVNKLDVQVGDYVGSFEVVAEVINESGKEIVTFVSEADRELFNVGAEVLIEETANGQVSQISPTVDSTTGKIEIRIATDDETLTGGDVVRISKSVALEEISNGPVLIPLSAVKFESEDGFVLKVKDGVLFEQPVTLGTIRGGSVEVLEGLMQTDAIVRDARGLQSGIAVTVNQ